MDSCTRRRLREQGGATAVEFSLIATLLFLLLFGILQFGLTYNRQQGLHHAVREGARLASLGNDVTPADVVSRVHAAAPAFIGDEVNDLDITVTPVNWCGDLDSDGEVDGGLDVVTVSVDIAAAALGKYQVSLPVVGNFFPDLSADAEFRCESPRDNVP